MAQTEKNIVQMRRNFHIANLAHNYLKPPVNFLGERPYFSKLGIDKTQGFNKYRFKDDGARYDLFVDVDGERKRATLYCEFSENPDEVSYIKGVVLDFDMDEEGNLLELHNRDSSKSPFFTVLFSTPDRLGNDAVYSIHYKPIVDNADSCIVDIDSIERWDSRSTEEMTIEEKVSIAKKTHLPMLADAKATLFRVLSEDYIAPSQLKSNPLVMAGSEQ